MAEQSESVTKNDGADQGLPGTPHRPNRVKSWKTLFPAMILAALLLFIAFSIPAYRRGLAIKRLGEHGGTVSLRQEDEWIRENFGDGVAVYCGRVDLVFFEVLSDDVLSDIAVLHELTHLRGNVDDVPTSVSQAGIESLKSLSHVEDLYIVGYGFSDELLAEWLSARPPIRSAEVKRTGADTLALNELSQIPSLARFDYFSTTVSDDDFATLGTYPNLQELMLNGPLLGDHAAEWASNSIELRDLHLKTPQVTDYGMECISRLPKLRNLLLWDCEHVTEAGVVYLEAMTDLELLLIPAHLVTPKSVEAMLRMPTLRHLHVSGLIDDADLRDQLSQRFDLQESGSHESSP